MFYLFLKVLRKQLENKNVDINIVDLKYRLHVKTFAKIVLCFTNERSFLAYLRKYNNKSIKAINMFF